ncbi:50S ribosomal protein L9 [Patescibacteria group bacterium]|nr:50S ribosomal protein L9 [Patescibacteria group bacterium]
MRVILNQDVKKLGYRGDVVAVKDGYFANFLLPKGLAVAATAKLLKLVDKRKEKVLVEKERLLDNVKEVLEKLKGLEVVIKHKATDAGKLYGAITEQEVIEAVEKAVNIRLEKDFVKMEHFKDLGDHEVLVSMGTDAQEKILVKVEKA